MTDSCLIYEATFLAATALFEALLEEMLVEMVCGADSTRRGVYRLVEVRNRSVFRAIRHQDRQYARFLPFSNAKRLARAFLFDGRPFTTIAEQDADLLSQVVKTRNAIAHRSEKAMRQFRKEVPGVDLLPPWRRFPGPFLRSVFRAAPSQRRIDLYFNVLVVVAKRIADSW